MNTLNRFCQCAALSIGLILLNFSLPASADEMQDINSLFKQSQYDQALERVNAYLVGKPKDAQARFLKGLILTEKGQPTEAIGLFTTLTEDYPELPEPYNNLAVLYAGQGQYDKARTALEMAIRTHPSYATAHENLGDIYAKMASQAYDRALQLDRSNASTQTKLALIKDLFVSSKGGKSTAVTTPPAPVATAPIAVTIASASKQQSATPAPAPVPVPVPAAKPVERNSDEVLKTVHNWAAAWSSQNVKNYLAYYADDFKTPGGESLADWKTARTERIKKPKSIQVSVNKPKIVFTDDVHATASFVQSYRASHLKASSSKTLLLVNSGNKWLIQEERSEK